MANQIVVSAGAKVRNLQDVIIGTSGVLTSLGFDVANGVPKLDVNGKILVSQLPNSVMEYKGTWNISTNTPTLVNGTGNQGDVYLVEGAAVGGTSFNFGAGSILFFNGDQAIYSGSIWQRASGATGTVTSVALTESGDSLNITGSPITTSGTINIGFNGTNLQYVNGAGNLTTFPILTGYVPYTGATQDVDLGAFKLNAQSLHIKGTGGLGHLGLKHQSASATASANEVSLFADSLGDLSWLNGNLYLSKFITSGNTAARSYTFPNANGTVALTSDLTGYLTAVTATSPLSSSGGTTPNITIAQATTSANGYLSSTDWNTFNGKQNAITLTTTGSSGVSTLVGATLNIPDYGSALTGYVTLATTQTITGAKTFSAYTTFTSTVDITSGLTFSNSGFTLVLQPPTLSVNRTVTLPNGTGTLALTSDISYPVTSVFGRTGAVVATEGDYSLTQLSDVTITTPSSGQVLRYSGTAWVNSTETYVGTVTSVAALTIGTSGTDLSSTVANSTTTPVITLNVPTASATNRGALSSADWTTFNNKQSALTNPVLASGTWTSGYLPKINGTYTIGNSLVYDNGTSVVIGTATPATNYILTLRTQAADYTKVLDWGTAAGGSWGNMTINTSAPYQTILNSGAWQFNISGTQKMLLDASGNLGLGVTPSAWGSGQRAIQTPAGAIWNFNSSNMSIVQNVFSDGTEKYVNNGFASTYNQNSGQHVWRTAPSGTAGAAITFTQAMTLTASGRLLIGTPTEASYMLDVNGTGRFSGALTGTSASFSGSSTLLTLSSGAGTKAVFETTRAFGVNRNFQIAVDEYAEGQFTITPSTTQGGSSYTTPIFKLASTGAATFSNKVGVGGAAATYSLTAYNGANGTTAAFGGTARGLRIDNDGTFSSGRTTIYGVDNTFYGSYQPLAIGGSELYFSIAGTDRLTIASTGAATFSSSVTVGGSTAQLFLNGSGGYAWIQYQNNGAGDWIHGTNVGGSGQDWNLYNYGTSSSALYIKKSNNNVGIGTSSPTYKFETLGTSVITAAFGRSDYGASNVMLIAMNGYRDVYKQAIGVVRTGDYDKGDMIFCLNGSANSTVVSASDERMRITSGGYLKASNAGTYLGSTGAYHELRQSAQSTASVVVSATNASFDNNVLAVGTTRTANSAFNLIAAYANDFADLKFKVDGTGAVTATSFFESSSIKGKDIIATNPLLALDIDVIKYTRKSDESKDIRYGYSAEQIHSLMPELTDKDVTAVKYLDVHTILIAQLQQEITTELQNLFSTQNV